MEKPEVLIQIDVLYDEGGVLVPYTDTEPTNFVKIYYTDGVTKGSEVGELTYMNTGAIWQILLNPALLDSGRTDLWWFTFNKVGVETDLDGYTKHHEATVFLTPEQVAELEDGDIAKINDASVADDEALSAEKIYALLDQYTSGGNMGADLSGGTNVNAILLTQTDGTCNLNFDIALTGVPGYATYVPSFVRVDFAYQWSPIDIVGWDPDAQRSNVIHSNTTILQKPAAGGVEYNGSNISKLHIAYRISNSNNSTGWLAQTILDVDAPLYGSDEALKDLFKDDPDFITNLKNSFKGDAAAMQTLGTAILT